jgi:hypothetical protein
MNVSDFEKGGKFQWHTSGGQVYTMDSTTGAIAEGAVNDKAIVDASKVPDPTTGLTPGQTQAAADRAATRASTERIAQWRISAQKEIASGAQAIQRDRLKLSADQFQRRYPGAGHAHARGRRREGQGGEYASRGRGETGNSARLCN